MATRDDWSIPEDDEGKHFCFLCDGTGTTNFPYMEYEVLADENKRLRKALVAIDEHVAMGNIHIAAVVLSAALNQPEEG